MNKDNNINTVMKTERFAVLGHGKHADRFIIPAISNSKLAELKLISRRPYGNYLEAVNSSEIDSLYICLPNSMHCEWTLAALQAGKNVICEKPLAYQTQSTNEVIQAQQKSGKKLLEAFMYRFHPQHQIVKKLLSANEIGTPRLFEAHFHYYLDDYSNIRLSPELAGGGLMDVGCYLTDACLFFFNDKIKNISGSWIIDQRAKVDEFANTRIEFSSGLVANLTCGCKLNRQSSYTIFGDKGKITVRDAFKIPKNKKGLVLLETLDGRKSEIFSEAADHYQFMIDHFCSDYQNDLELLNKRAQLLEMWKTACTR